jgi:SOS response regulatory protein OraA/RecX
MSNADGERIAPVTYLFGARPSGEQPGSGVDEGPSPSAAAEPRVPVFVDLGADPAQNGQAQPDRHESEHEPESRVRESPERNRKGSFDRISNVSMYALARRGMSSREMRDYLLGREFAPGEVEDEVERLESVALLDDVALGESLVRTLRDRKGLGRGALTAELRRRNLDATAIELALDGLDDDELERATEVAHKRASQLRSYDAETVKRRLSSFLMRKGYSGSVVSTAVQRALAPAGPTFR